MTDSISENAGMFPDSESSEGETEEMLDEIESQIKDLKLGDEKSIESYAVGKDFVTTDAGGCLIGERMNSR